MGENRESNTASREDLSLSVMKANVYGVLIALLPIAFFSRLYVEVWGYGDLKAGMGMIADPKNLLVFYCVVLAVFVTGVVAHELIHGLLWAYFAGKPLASIEFGFQIKMLTPYAHCKEPLHARHYRLGLMMPGVLLGIIPSLLRIAVGSGWMTLFGLFFTLAAGGDALILWLTRKVNARSLVEDHSSRAGCYVFGEDILFDNCVSLECINIVVQ